MKRKEMWKRGLAIVLSAAMISPFLPAEASAETTAPLLANFTFDDEASVLTGGNAKATVNGSYQLTDSKDAANGKALYLDGNAANYLSVTDAGGKSLLAGKEEITVSYDAKPDQTATSWIFYAAPDTRTQSAPEYYIGAFANGGGTKVERYKNGRTVSFTTTTGTDWAHVDIVYSKTTTTAYVNGVKKESVENSNASLTDILGDSGILYIGRANWGSGEGYKGWIDNFKIYDGALTDEDLTNADSVKEAVAADKASLTLPEEVDGDFTLPSKGNTGSDVTWTVAKNDYVVIDTDGYSVKVVRPAYEDGDVTVTFTATITMQGVSDTKDIPVKIIKEKSDQDIVTAAYESLDIATKGAVMGNIDLPSEVAVEGAMKKAVVTWKSSDSAIVTDTVKDGKAAGVVTRPAEDTEVTLTASITCGTVQKTKTFVLNVIAAPEEKPETTDYLFAYFTGSEGSATDEQIYFSTSEDGCMWTDLTANGSPVLWSDIGDKGVRDPYLIRSAEGDKFWLIATDLSIYYRGGWGKANATTEGSTNLVVWESTNLVDWSEPRLVDVAGSIPEAGCAWAPEAMYDANSGNYVVYWATASDVSNVNGDRMNMYYATTRDFYTFSEPVLWIDRQSSIIDTTMIQVGDKYYRASGDGQITIEESDSIYEGWQIIGTLKDIFNNNNYSGAKLEGPEFFKYNTDDYLTDAEGNPVETWGLMCDQYSEGKGYLPFRTTNIADQTTASWSPATDVNFGSLKKRHGTILPITRDEYNLIMQEIGGIGPEEPIDKKVLAQFDFDDETSGFVSENAKAEGGCTLTDSSTTENGKAIYLAGTDANYLKVTDKNGGSLLTGARELTISFEAKTDRTETNWVFYAAPNDNTQSYTNERYIGVMIGGGKVTAERYNNSGSRPTSPSANVSGDWERIDVVLNRTSTAIYINGEKKAEEQSAYNIANLLGDSSILQVGKANWVNGEYYKGWLDNLTIRNYAMTAEEIAADIAGTPEDPVELPFVDVAEDAWYYDAVYYNYVVQTMTGKDDTHFAPDEALARAQFAMILYRMNDTPNVEYKATFPDVADNVWYTDAILWAADTGVVTGYSDSGKFGPSDRINREQMAVMMYRYAKYKEYESDAPADITGYADAGRVSAFAKEAMEWAVGNGIISGKDGGTVLDPQGNATRAECATIIMRFLEKFEK